MNSVLFSLPFFLLTFFRIPVWVANKIVKLQRDFLLGCGDQGRRKKWEDICKPRELGGLGIKNVIHF